MTVSIRADQLQAGDRWIFAGPSRVLVGSIRTDGDQLQVIGRLGRRTLSWHVQPGDPVQVDRS